MGKEYVGAVNFSVVPYNFCKYHRVIQKSKYLVFDNRWQRDDFACNS
jgi:hypothetical protein